MAAAELPLYQKERLVLAHPHCSTKAVTSHLSCPPGRDIAHLFIDSPIYSFT